MTTEYVRYCHYEEKIVDGRMVYTYGLEVVDDGSTTSQPPPQPERQ